jgi:hypothetical protein
MYKPITKSFEYIASATNKLFEYAACALPPIMPDLPNYRELLDGETVAYANPYDPASIARTVKAIFADREQYLHGSLAALRFFAER